MRYTYISKNFSTLKDAEKYQQSLYNEFNHVKLILCPLFSEAGKYIWEVK